MSGNFKRYKIDYGFGIAYLETPYNPQDRFPKLANTCFGIRKSIMGCNILSVTVVEKGEYERLEFNGDCYIWREDGARKMISPFKDADWDTDYCEECRI